jgi:hypothetical protein
MNQSKLTSLSAAANRAYTSLKNDSPIACKNNMFIVSFGIVNNKSRKETQDEIFSRGVSKLRSSPQPSNLRVSTLPTSHHAVSWVDIRAQ